MSDIKIEKGKGESFETFFRRFKSRERDSGKPLTVKAIRFFARKPNKNRVQDSALRRIKKHEKIAYLVQSGKLLPEEIRNYRG
jgi:hypothetical protein